MTVTQVAGNTWQVILPRSTWRNLLTLDCLKVWQRALGIPEKQKTLLHSVTHYRRTISTATKVCLN